MTKKLFFFFWMLFFPIILFSQNTILDTNPPSVKWDRIITPYFKVVYPIGYEKAAQRTANILETVYEPGALSLNKFPKRTSVILQNQSTISNGFVSWVPYRSEFFTFPSQDYLFTGNNDWMELLSIHEFRHMVQIQKSKTGFTKIVNVLFGQATTANIANFAVPNWFWEGDATMMETALTPSGRGRLPNFSMAMRSNIFEKGAFTYNKQYLRSLKDFVPNEYATGYFFGGYLRKKYGPEMLEEATLNAWNWSFVPFTFSISLKKYSGNYLVKNYNAFMADQKITWQSQLDKLNPEEYTSISKRSNNVYTNYKYPHLMTSGNILALKNGQGNIAEFIAVDKNGVEERIFIPGLINNTERISFNGSKIVWNEFTPDVRWSTRNYSDIKLYDFKKGKISKISTKGRYASSAISPDGTKVVSVMTKNNGQNSLVVTDLKGEIFFEFNNPDNYFFITPEWSEDGESIFAIELYNRNKTLVQYKINDRASRKIIFEAGHENISYPKIYGNLLFYQSPYNGIDNIYLIDLATNEHYQATNAKYGSYYPYFDIVNSTLYFSDHQEFGLNISSKTIEKLPLKSTVPVYNDPLAEILTEQESGEIESEDITTHEFPVEKYSKLKGIVNPHSWGVTLGSNTNELQFFINSTDIRSSTQINAGYAYNVNEKMGKWEAGISYQGLFPITTLNFVNGKRGMTEEILDTARSFSWNEKGAELGITIPLLFTNSKYRRALFLNGKGGFYHITDYPFYPYDDPQQLLNNGTLKSLKTSAIFNRLLKTSQRDIYSKWGQSIETFFYSTPFGGDYFSNLMALQGTLYFPGLANHHSLFIRAGYQYEDNINYTFSSPLLFPRGYTYSSFNNLYTASANYSLPLLYPDLGIGPLLYIQRVRANVFYDYGWGSRNIPNDFLTNKQQYQSIGLELNFDFNVMRYKALLDMGVRIIYLPETNSYTYNVLIGTLGF